MKTTPSIPHFAHWTRLNALEIQQKAIPAFSGFQPLSTSFAETLTREALDETIEAIQKLPSDPSWSALAASASKYIALPATPSARKAPTTTMHAPILQTSLAIDLDDIKQPIALRRITTPMEPALDPDHAKKNRDDEPILPATHLARVLSDKNIYLHISGINDRRQHSSLRALCHEMVASKLPAPLAALALSKGSEPPKTDRQTWMAIRVQLSLLAASAPDTHPLPKALAIFDKLSALKHPEPNLLRELLALPIPDDGLSASKGLANLQHWIAHSERAMTPKAAKAANPSRQTDEFISFYADSISSRSAISTHANDSMNRSAAKFAISHILYSHASKKYLAKLSANDAQSLALFNQTRDDDSRDWKSGYALLAELIGDDLAAIPHDTPKPLFLRATLAPEEVRAARLASLNESIHAAADTLYANALDIAKAREHAFIAELGFDPSVAPEKLDGLLDIKAARAQANQMLVARSSGAARCMGLLAQATSIHDMANLRARLGYLDLGASQLEAFCTPKNLADLAEILRPIEPIRKEMHLSANDMSFPAINALLFLVRKSKGIAPASLGERAMRELSCSDCGELFALAFKREYFNGTGKRLPNGLHAINAVFAWPKWIDEAEPKLAAGAVLDFAMLYYQRGPAEFCAAFCTLAAAGSKSLADDKPLQAEALRVADRIFNAKDRYAHIPLGLALDNPQPPRLPFSEMPSMERAFFHTPEAMIAAALEPDLESLLAQQGLPGYLAKLCVLSSFTNLPTDADAQSKANIALAGAKEAAKAWLGASSAGWKLLLEAEGERKDFKKNLAKRAFEHYQSSHDSAAAASAHSWQSQLKLSGWCYSEAAARGLDAKGAKAALAGISSWQELAENESFDTRLLEAPLAEGSTISQSLADLKQESLAREAKIPMVRLAIIERAKKHRADDIQREQAALLAKKKIGVGFFKAAGALESEIEDISDWPSDQVGRFWRNLPAKIGWTELARGSKQWHEAQIAMEASNPAAKGPGWQACGVSYSDPETGLSAHELLTAAALQAEGAAMRHCVGSYGERCRDGNARIFSIRKDDVRVATLELAPPSQPENSSGLLTDLPGPWKISQLKGPCNAEPSEPARKAAIAIAEAAQAAMALRREEAIKNTPSKTAKEIKALSRIPTELPGFDPYAILDKLRSKKTPAPQPSDSKKSKGS